MNEILKCRNLLGFWLLWPPSKHDMGAVKSGRLCLRFRCDSMCTVAYQSFGFICFGNYGLKLGYDPHILTVFAEFSHPSPSLCPRTDGKHVHINELLKV